MRTRAVFPDKLTPYLLLAPQLAVTLVFFIWPAFQALRQSVLVEDAFGLSTRFVWFENFARLFRDPNYLHSFEVTAVFSLAVAFFGMALSLLMAAMAILGSNRPTNSSSTKIAPAIGALKVAEMPPAAPQATSSRSCDSETRISCPMTDPRADPICTIGPSRPTAAPLPIDNADASDFATATIGRITPRL